MLLRLAFVVPQCLTFILYQHHWHCAAKVISKFQIDFTATGLLTINVGFELM